MKKWHMESILSLSTGQKLAVPESHQLYSVTSVQLRNGGEKEVLFLIYLRKIVSFLERMF